MLKRKFTTYLLMILLLFAVTLSCGLALNSAVSASAQTDLRVQPEPAETYSDGIEPFGLYTNLNVVIKGGNGYVYGKANNKFTLGKSTVAVYVELYSSYTYCTDYTQMKLEKSGYCADLDIGKSFEISVPTGGEQKYWLARMQYRLDSKDWVSKTTETHLINANGDLV